MQSSIPGATHMYKEMVYALHQMWLFASSPRAPLTSFQVAVCGSCGVAGLRCHRRDNETR